MAKKKIDRLRKDFYISDEYGRTDAVLVRKINELIGIVNQQQEEIRTLKLLLNERKKQR